MAIDTRDKRASAFNHRLPWRRSLPVADGTINQGDRQHTVWMYRGIAAGAAAPKVPFGEWNIRTRKLSWNLTRKLMWIMRPKG